MPPRGDDSNVDGRHRAAALLRRSRAAFCIATFFFWVSIFVYVPILPVYAHTVVDSLAMVGVVLSSYALPQLLFRIPVGLYYDATVRRKRIVMLSIVLGLGSALGLAFATTGITLFLARAVAGVASAGWVAFTMLFTGYYSMAHSARAIGTINAVNQVALLAATGSGGVLADMWGYRTVFLVAACLAAGSLLIMSFAREPATTPPAPRTIRGFRSVVTSPLLLASGAMAVLMQFATFSTIFGFTPTYAASIGANNSQLGVITMLALAASAASAVVSVRIAERLGYTATLCFGAVLMGGSLAVVPFLTTPFTLAAMQLVSGLGRGALLALLMALCIRSAPPEVRATQMGVFQAVYAIGSLTGPVISGMVADAVGLAAVFYISAAMALGIALVALHPAVRRV
jgi:predicted MFS family arabinose efflux permease